MTDAPATAAGEPSAAPPPPSWRDALAAAVPLSLAASLATPAPALLLSGGAMLVTTSSTERPEGLVTLWVVALAVALAGWPPAVGLLLRRPWARPVALALASGNFVLASLGVWASVVRREPARDLTASVVAGLVLAHALLLLTRPAAGWFSDARDRQAAPTGAPGYACGVGWALVLAWGVGVIVPRFREIFASMGVELPWITAGVLGVSDAALRAPFLLYPLAILAPLPLLYVPAPRRVTLALANLVGALVVSVAAASIYLPIAALQEALRQR